MDFKISPSKIFKILIVVFGISLFIHILFNEFPKFGNCPQCDKVVYLENGKSKFCRNSDENSEIDPGLEASLLEKKSEAFLLSESINMIQSIPHLPHIVQTFKGKCGRYPNLYNIHFSNIYWQQQELIGDVTAYLLNAYLDTRPEKPTVRIIGMIDEPNIKFKMHCQFWYLKDLKTAKIVEVSDARKTYYPHRDQRRKGFHHSYLISCELPDGDFKNASLPDSVSLVYEQCASASNNLRLRYEVPEKVEDFAVCVKGMDFIYEDVSTKIAEWIDLLGILGVTKIFLYNFQIHSNVTKILSYYEKTEQVEIIPITWPGFSVNEPRLRHHLLQNNGNGMDVRRKNELVHYNDCFYRNIHKFKYIAILDTDEIFMPLNGRFWKNLTDMSPDAPAFYFHMYYFFEDDRIPVYEEDVPSHFNMLKHLERSGKYLPEPWRGKSILNTEKVLTVFNHFPPHCFPDPNADCLKNSYHVPPEIGQAHHYRSNWNIRPYKNVFNEVIIKDVSILRYKEELMKRTNIALSYAGLIN